MLYALLHAPVAKIIIISRSSSSSRIFCVSGRFGMAATVERLGGAVLALVLGPDGGVEALDDVVEYSRKQREL